ncbi:MAG: endonuclease MutS2 [Chloroflexota bacterium]
MGSKANSNPEEELQEKTLELLEFPQVLDLLSVHAQTSLAKELALSLTPAYTYQEVQRRQHETTEAALFLVRGKNVDLSMAKDVRQSVESAGLGGKLPGSDLRDVHDTTKVLKSVRTIVGSQRELPILSSVAKQIPDLEELESELSGAIGRDGEVLDEASPQLAALRIQARDTYDRLEKSLQRIIRGLHARGILQESLITQRQGRMVLLVKAEMRHHVQGIVHDVSDSGATLFVEPMPTISIGNQWHELRLAAEREEDRVLRALSEAVGSRRDDLLLGVDLLARIDLAMAKARYSASVTGVPVAVVHTETPCLSLTEARHPLLPGEVVPNTIELGHKWTLILITGPNAGGKTVALKTAGLLAVMAQAGLHVPAKEAIINVFNGFYADIGDQQSIQRSLSTFSSHVLNLSKILERATSSSLVLIDELGTSTDPEEGAALAKATLLELHRRGISVVATSHHRDVAAFVQENSGMTNASVELDPETLIPTYRLTMGLPERSYSITIAASLGMPLRVIEDARSLISEGYRQTEGLLRDLQRERHQAVERHREAEEELIQAQKLRLELEEKLADLEQEKDRLMEEARSDLRARVEEMWQRLRSVERAFQVPAPINATQVVKERKEDVSALKRELKSPSWRGGKTRRQWLKQLKSGDVVHLRGISQPAEVLSGPGEDYMLEVALGSMRAQVPLDEVERKADAAITRPRATTVTRAPASKMPAEREIDLRGTRVENALEQLDRFLDQAALGGLQSVRIVHGVGTGVLRSALREHLAQHVLVQSFGAEEGSNANGATVVELA